MSDLEFIRSVVKVWPESAITVRLDYDGEICFMDEDTHDFFPENRQAAIAAFVPSDSTAVGVEYTREQWEGAW